MAAQEETIANFTGRVAAFYRPRAHDYFLLEWNPHHNSWINKWCDPGVIFTLYKSRTTRNGKCWINVKTQQQKRIDVVVRGEYLETLQDGNPIRIPILSVDTRVDGMRYSSIPTSLLKPSYRAVQAAPENYETDYRLYNVAAPPAPAPAPQAERGGPPMNRRPQPAPVQITLEPIPRRIAWLVAAEAEKNGEQCPITIEDISPLTATVTTCFHCFEADALRAWHETKGGDLECPLCKKKCMTTKAYVEEPNLPLTDRPGE